MSRTQPRRTRGTPKGGQFMSQPGVETPVTLNAGAPPPHELRVLGYMRNQLDSVGLNHWHPQIGDHPTSLGRASHDHQVIEISRRLVEFGDPQQVRDTILHEVAHALTPEDREHGELWKAAAIRLGALPMERAAYKIPPVPNGIEYIDFRDLRFRLGHEFTMPPWGECSIAHFDDSDPEQDLQVVVDIHDNPHVWGRLPWRQLMGWLYMTGQFVEDEELLRERQADREARFRLRRQEVGNSDG